MLTKKYGHDLTEHYLRVLKPCIDWFRADIDYEEALEAALSYAYTSVTGIAAGERSGIRY